MYHLTLTSRAKKDLKTIDKRYSSAIAKAFAKLQANPKLGQPLSGELRGQWKLKFSRYRILYIIQEHEVMVTVVTVGHRREVYR